MACNSHRLLLFCLLVLLWDFNLADEEADIDDESSMEMDDSAEDSDSTYTVYKFTPKGSKCNMLQVLEACYPDDYDFNYNLMHYNVSPAIIASTCKDQLLKKVVCEIKILPCSNEDTKIIQGKIEKSTNELSQKICSTKDSSYKQEYFQHAFCISQYMDTFISTCKEPNNAILSLLLKMGAIGGNEGKSKTNYISRKDGHRILCKANKDLKECASKLLGDKCSKEAAQFMESMIQIGHVNFLAPALSKDPGLGSCEQYEAESDGTTETESEQDEPVQFKDEF